MLWPRKRLEPTAAAAPAASEPALAAHFSPELFSRHMAAFIETAAEDGGPQAYLLALAHKCERIGALTAALASRSLRMAEIEVLLGQVFTARRRLFPALATLGPERVSAALANIVAGENPAQERLQAFVDLIPGVEATDRDSLRAVARVRRAAWDFGTELLHFHAPEHYPLMSRWVWDAATQSGALRELMSGRALDAETGLDAAAAVFDTANEWAVEQLRSAGVFRELPLWIDLILARAYVDYLGAATQGHFGADFARGTTPRAQLRKLLGIDGERALGRSRVRIA